MKGSLDYLITPVSDVTPTPFTMVTMQRRPGSFIPSPRLRVAHTSPSVYVPVRSRRHALGVRPHCPARNSPRFERESRIIMSSTSARGAGRLDLVRQVSVGFNSVPSTATSLQPCTKFRRGTRRLNVLPSVRIRVFLARVRCVLKRGRYYIESSLPCTHRPIQSASRRLRVLIPNVTATATVPARDLNRAIQAF